MAEPAAAAGAAVAAPTEPDAPEPFPLAQYAQVRLRVYRQNRASIHFFFARQSFLP
jgi:hypothetical protein